MNIDAKPASRRFPVRFVGKARFQDTDLAVTAPPIPLVLVPPFDLKLSLGLGFRMEIPLLGNIGFDYGYGFQHDEFDPATGTYHRKGRFKGHFLIGNLNF